MYKSHIFSFCLLLAAAAPCFLFAMQANTSVLMVRPMAFGKNSQTAGTNAFQRDEPVHIEEDLSKKALGEFDEMVRTLKDHGVEVHVFEESHDASPDSIFPNNWFSLDPHSNTLVLYPLMAENRRAERKSTIIDYLRDKFHLSEILDLSPSESEALFLEGTGSIVFDYVNRRAYACLSPRTSQGLLIELCDKLHYTPVVFSAHDDMGTPIYHTNVMMAIGTDACIICSETITDPEERQHIISTLQSSGKKIVDITFDQMNHFCGNVLEVENMPGERFFVMSTQAFKFYSDEQMRVLSSQASVIHSDLKTIETVGGGGARCMLGGLWKITQ